MILIGALYSLMYELLVVKFRLVIKSKFPKVMYNRFSQKGIIYCRGMDTLKLLDKNGTKMVGFYDRIIARIWVIFNTPLENMIKDAFLESEVKIVLFGSRARGDYAKTSDIDIGILPKGKINKKKLILLREKVENSNIPYKVDVVDLSQTSREFKEKALKEGILWKSWKGE